MTFTLRKAIAIMAVVFMPATIQAQDITGLWRTEANEQGYLEIEFKNCGMAVCGTIVRARNLEGESAPYEHVGKLTLIHI